jgi:hypothetical protein
LSVWRYDGSTPYIYLVESTTGPVEPSVRAADTVRRLRVVWNGERLFCMFDNDVGDTGEITVAAGAADVRGAGGLRIYNETTGFLSFVLYR